MDHYFHHAEAQRADLLANDFQPVVISTVLQTCSGARGIHILSSNPANTRCLYTICLIVILGKEKRLILKEHAKPRAVQQIPNDLLDRSYTTHVVVIMRGLPLLSTRFLIFLLGRGARWKSLVQIALPRTGGACHYSHPAPFRISREFQRSQGTKSPLLRRNQSSSRVW